MFKGLKLPPDSTCRLCNRIGRKKKRILSKEWRDEKTNLKIEHVLGIKLLYHYRLSNSVCEECLDKLNYLDAFVKCAIANQELFAELIQDTHYHHKGKPNGKPDHRPRGRPPKQLCNMPISQPGRQAPPFPITQPKSYTAFLPNEKIGNSNGGNFQSTTMKQKVFVQQRTEQNFSHSYIESPYILDPHPPPERRRVSVKIEEEIDITSDGDEDTSSAVVCASKKVISLPAQLQNKSMLEITSVRSCTNEDHADRSHRENVNLLAIQADSNDSDDCVVLENESSPKKLKLSAPVDRIRTEPQLKPVHIKESVSQNRSKSTEVSVKQEDVNLEHVAEIQNSVSVKRENNIRDQDLREQSLWSKVIFCPPTLTKGNCSGTSLNCYKCNQSNPSYLYMLYHIMNHCNPVNSKSASLVLKPNILKKQCKSINIEETALLQKVDNEIEVVLKNRGNLGEEPVKICEQTKRVLVKYRKKQEKTLQKDVCIKQSANERSNDVPESSDALCASISCEQSPSHGKSNVIESSRDLPTFVSCEQSANEGKSNDTSESSSTRPTFTASKDEAPSLDFEVVCEDSDIQMSQLNNVPERRNVLSHEQSPSHGELNEISVSNGILPTSTASEDNTLLLDCEVTCEDSEEDSSDEKRAE